MKLVRRRQAILSWAIGTAAANYILTATADHTSALTPTTSVPTSSALFPYTDGNGARQMALQIEMEKASGTGGWPDAWTASTLVQAWQAASPDALRRINFLNKQGPGHPGPCINGLGATPSVHELAITNAQSFPAAATIGETGILFVHFSISPYISDAPPVVMWLLSFVPSTVAPTDTHTITLTVSEWLG